LRVLVEENRAEYLTSLSRYIEDPEFIERILPVMRKDMPLLKSYKYKEQDSLDVPITVWAANQDDVVYPDEVSQWSQHTNKEFQFYEVDGDHWFLNSNKDRISEVLRQIL
jgi:surfactin synthase thioesterase subunit